MLESSAVRARPIHGVIEVGVALTLCRRQVKRCIVVDDPFDPAITCKRCLRQLEWA